MYDHSGICLQIPCHPANVTRMISPVWYAHPEKRITDKTVRTRLTKKKNRKRFRQHVRSDTQDHISDSSSDLSGIHPNVPTDSEIGRPGKMIVVKK